MHTTSLVTRNIHHMKRMVVKTYCQRRYYHFLKATVESTNRILSSYTAIKKTSRSCHVIEEYQPSSALYISGKSQLFAPFLTPELDLEDRLKDINCLKKNLEVRGLEDTVDVEELVSQYKKMTELMNKTNQMSKEEWRKNTKEFKNEYWDLVEKVTLMGLKLPNYLHPDTPETVEVLEQIGSPAAVGKSESHISIAQKYDLVKFSDIGKKAYFFKSDLAMLEQALLSYVCKKLGSKGYIQANITEFFRTLAVEGAGMDFKDFDQIYLLKQKAEGTHVDNLPMTGYYARGVSLVTFTGMVAKKIYMSSYLPLHYFVSGRSYITESAQEKLPGLFGALQTMKVETMSLCNNSASAESVYKQYWEELVEMYKLFQCPLRLIRVPGESLQPSEQMRSEIQMWAPGVQSFIKVASVSMIGDFISKRMMCRHRETKKGKMSFLYMVHSEVLDVTRLIALLMEYGDSGKDVYRLPDLSFLDEYYIVKQTKS